MVYKMIDDCTVKLFLEDELHQLQHVLLYSLLCPSNIAVHKLDISVSSNISYFLF